MSQKISPNFTGLLRPAAADGQRERLQTHRFGGWPGMRQPLRPPQVRSRWPPAASRIPRRRRAHTANSLCKRLAQHVDRRPVLDAAAVAGLRVDGRSEFQQHRQMVRQFPGRRLDAGRAIDIRECQQAIPRFRVSPAV